MQYSETYCEVGWNAPVSLVPVSLKPGAHPCRTWISDWSASIGLVSLLETGCSLPSIAGISCKRGDDPCGLIGVVTFQEDPDVSGLETKSFLQRRQRCVNGGLGLWTLSDLRWALFETVLALCLLSLWTRHVLNGNYATWLLICCFVYRAIELPLEFGGARHFRKFSMVPLRWSLVVLVVEISGCGAVLALF